jgi:hypothetical protein
VTEDQLARLVVNEAAGSAEHPRVADIAEVRVDAP